MSALLDQAAKEARQGNLDLKHQTIRKKAKQYEGKVIDLEKAIEEAENDCNENDLIAPATASGAGCGKSVVVRTIFQALHRHLCSIEGEDPDDIRILLCAPTGKAAYNINGLTIHNAFQIQPNKGLDQSLSCDVLNTLRMKYRNLSLILN
ncbi:Hypothetical predicted protein [Mytilus galloprovincialis]|uniref:ATP-dependent DNA helicase n=1 Tax=Mytilus galloprovincialis TaxID=29158 RepID=A0A8B6HGH5_MYTGA|nr:Hypothetical predicted protein [Mytilus galloprovincialis]